MNLMRPHGGVKEQPKGLKGKASRLILLNMKSQRAKALMILGTGSGVGKSIIAAGILRALRNRGFACAPFKAQNMALNSFVTLDGLEMGRAQAYQAEAAGLTPDCRMNPILLKPNGDSTSQVIVLGRPTRTVSAKGYYALFPEHLKVVRDAYDSLSKGFEVMVLEGAGSPAEINIQARDLVNLRMADHAGAKCLLVGDIDKGGVFAWLKGTLDLVEDKYRPLIRGLVINKFRGDERLLRPGLEAFESIAGIPFLGVLPWLRDIVVDQEDSMFLEHILSRKEDAEVRIGVVRLKMISNFTDFIPLSLEPDCSVELVTSPEHLLGLDCVIIPGSKSTRSDLGFLESSGLKQAIKCLAKKGDALILGICGGYQMLGLEVRDPRGVEGKAGESEGLGLLPVVTEMLPGKYLAQIRARLTIPGMDPATVHGYEIHAGTTWRVHSGKRCIPISDDPGIGHATADGRVIGVYLHGLFEDDDFRRSFLNLIRVRKGLLPVERSLSYREFKERNLDALAQWIEEGLSMEAILDLLGLG